MSSTPNQHQSRSAGDASPARTGVVVRYSDAESDYAAGHENITRSVIAKRLAALMGYDFRGEYDPQTEYGAALYFMPSGTLVGAETARRLGIRGEENLYGGVVPFPFVE